MDKLVTRDFFPHYDNLKDQNDYLEAEEDGDTEKMREIAVKYRKRTGERPTTGAWTVGGTPLMTPADFDGSSPNREKDPQKVKSPWYLNKNYLIIFGLANFRFWASENLRSEKT